MTRSLRNLLTVAALLLWGVSSCCGGIRAGITAHAREQVVHAERTLQQSNASIRDAESALARARRVHHAAYLKDVSNDGQAQSLRRAEGLLREARAVRHPDRKVELVRRASREMGSVATPLQERTDYFRRLDTALDRYEAETEDLARKLAEARRYVDGLESEGYRPSHFEYPRKALAAGTDLHRQAVVLAKRPLEDGRPDYLRVYDTCLSGIERAGAARAHAEAVPALRLSNTRRGAALRTALAAARGRYYEARVAALNLERYPRYRSIRKVETARESLVPLDAGVAAADAANSMSRQEFEAAAQGLSRLEGILSAADGQFRRSIGDWAAVTAAIAAIPEAERAAGAEIRSAESRISSYSYNSQTRAKGLVSDAESAVSRGRNMRDLDPPGSLAAFQEAKRHADAAYSAVDTSSRNDDDDDGGGGFGGGSSGGGGGSSGPSGGGFGGPSGGGFGGGGF